MRELAACVAACLIVGAPPSLDYRQTAPVGHHLYDQNTSHLWNRVHDTFHVRVAPDGSEYGLDAVDPLMWRETRHLLTGDSHARALGLLDEFLTSNGERLIRDPLKRAVFQNDLWARPSSRRCGRHNHDECRPTPSPGVARAEARSQPRAARSQSVRV
jgi:hypothetical protein